MRSPNGESNLNSSRNRLTAYPDLRDMTNGLAASEGQPRRSGSPADPRVPPWPMPTRTAQRVLQTKPFQALGYSGFDSAVYRNVDAEGIFPEKMPLA